MRTVKNVKIVLTSTNAMPFKWENGSFMCFFCPHICGSWHDVRKHTLRCGFVYNIQTAILSALSGPSDPNIYVNVTKLKCSLCKEGMSSLDVLLQHLKDEHAELGYATDAGYCLLPFRLDGPTLQCLQCNKITANAEDLMEHTLSVHTAARGFCDDCGKAFVGQRSLYNHKRLIHPKNGLKCCKCERVFDSSATLQRHNSNDHYIPKICPLCSKEFNSRYKLKKHVLESHSPGALYECPYCSHKYVNKSHMDVHIKRIHVVDNPKFECGICGFLTTGRLRLSEHMNRHMKIKPYDCPLCERSFYRRDAVVKHISHYHKENPKDYRQPLKCVVVPAEN